MIFRRIDREEISKVVELFARAFRYDATRRIEGLRNNTERFPYSDCYLLEDRERGAVAATVLFERMVTVGGATLAAGLLGSVGVPPEQRRRGYASRMMTAALEEMRRRGLPLSLLFPYSIPFYNRLGYGVAQHSWYLELPLKELMDFDELGMIRRMTEEDLPAMQRLYDGERFRHNGWLSRTEWEWHERVLDLPGKTDWPNRTEGVVVPGKGSELRGYLTYSLGPTATPPKEMALFIQEWVSEEEAAWRALAGFVSAQRAQAKFVRYTAPEGFPLHHALRERNAYRDRRRTEFTFRDTLSRGIGVMLRLVNPAEAFAQRGYPKHLNGECIIRIHDDQLPANEEPLHLRVEAGRATINPAATDRNKLPTAAADVRTWSELYAAALSPGDAHLLGRLAADRKTLRFLTQLFDAAPWFLHRADWF